MPINDFKPFAAGPGANVTSQADWENLPALLSGFMSGKASSAQMNKAFRQASFIAAALAQFVSEKTDQDVLDDGDLPGFVEKLTAGFAAQYLSRSNPFGDIASDGAEAIATALANLRLGAGAPPIGIPFFWPMAAMPNTVMDEWSDMLFLKANGSSFSAVTYPKLAQVWTGLVIPDMRGEFLRIRDDGRGVDAGRALLSAQAGAAPEIVGAIEGSTKLDTGYDIGAFGNSSGAFSFTGTTTMAAQTTTTAASTTRNTRAEFRASRSSSVYGGASELRPRNIAFDFLVRAK
ncbi:phage tail protein [Citrobacter farmeri]|uniref:phage tail protein n=1 Tax=Citrobacter farmeri TaxID=67824 RepID=UPI00339BD5FC